MMNRLPEPLLLKLSQQASPMSRSQSMQGRHRCPCCSGVLLRHASLRGLYWHCDHCHQEMPVLDDYVPIIL